MTSKLKCPFCQQELRQDYTGVMYCCNEDCEQSADWYGSQILWQALIQAKQDLENAKADIEDYKKDKALWEQIRNNTILELERKLKTARNALKDARIFANTHCIATAVKTIDKALEQIQQKENK